MTHRKQKRINAKIPAPDNVRIKVTRIRDKYCIRGEFMDKDGCWLESRILSSSNIEDKLSIHDAIHFNLRMWDKCGGTSKMATRARHRKYEKLDKLQAWKNSLKENNNE